ncbi:MAG: hypothetical protein KDA36_11425, partial [Planctomycetaceae bacterium]|nr:hypothetical protein [Planctomycetaceae bacterium]
RYNSAGLPQDSEFQVNTFTTGVQWHPSIAMDADGDFVITWQSPNQDGSGYGVYAQRYDSLGVPQGSEFRVNSWTNGSQLNPSIAMDVDGDFVITWQSETQDGSGDGLYAQRYDHLGVPQGSEFRVNSWTTNHQRDPLIGMDADGDFVITWKSLGQDGSDYGVFAQRFDSLGVPQDSEFRVHDWTTGSQVNRLIGMKADGEFLIAWYGLADYAYISGSTGVYVKQFRFHNAAPILDDTGSPALDPLKLNQPLTTNYGTSVSDIIARMGPYGGITDPDLDLIGIAINGVSNSNGSWQYSFNNGYTWTPITVTGNTNALLMIPRDYIRIRFVPDTDFTGKSFFSFVAWDRTNGFNGDTADVSNRGGSTPFSLDYEYARITVNNSAPILIDAGNPTLDTIPMNVNPGDNPGTLVSDIIARMGPYGGMTDVDGDPLGIAINGVSNTDGFWEYTVNGGTTWLTIGTTGNLDALLLASNPDTRIRFIPNPGFIGKSLIAFVAWDGTFGSNGGTAVVSTRGGNTAFSLVYEYA